MPLTAETNIKVASGNLIDKAVFRKVSVPNESYVLKDAGDKGANWTNKE